MPPPLSNCTGDARLLFRLAGVHCIALWRAVAPPLSPLRTSFLGVLVDETRLAQIEFKSKKRRRKTVLLKRTNPPEAARDRLSSEGSQETEAVRLTRELRDALKQLTTTAEILEVIRNYGYGNLSLAPG